ncbi:MAG: AAA family ATPase [Paracoccaceae bacterium]
MAARVYITGAAGTGCTSLGRALAERLGILHLDTDDFYWEPSDPPYTRKRPRAERLALIAAEQIGTGPDGGWVLSGSADGWGDVVLADANLIVFLSAPTPIRLARIRKREAARFGERIKPGGDMVRVHRQFLDWAASYDEPYSSGRSLTRHRNWLAAQTAPVVELSGTIPVAEQLAAVMAAL